MSLGCVRACLNGMLIWGAMICKFFFFSSRRRHTRFDCDWSSDVCSSDLKEILEMTQRMAEIIARHTGQPLEQVLKDIDRDHFMAPEEAVAYGLVDEVIQPDRKSVV